MLSAQARYSLRQMDGHSDSSITAQKQCPSESREPLQLSFFVSKLQDKLKDGY